MKITEIKVGATIATGQYQNIQPSLTISEVENVAEATQFATEFIKEHFERFSVTGVIKDNEVVLTEQKKSPLTKI